MPKILSCAMKENKQGKGNRMPGRGQVEILKRVTMEGFAKWGHLSEDPRKVRKGASHADVWGLSLPGRAFQAAALRQEDAWRGRRTPNRLVFLG